MRVKKLFALVLSSLFCLQMFSTMSFATSAFEGDSISGDGVCVTWDGGAITLYRMDDTASIQISQAFPIRLCILISLLGVKYAH